VIPLVEVDLEAMAPKLTEGGAFSETPLVQRVDPLFGHSCRIVAGAKLQPEQAPNLEEITIRKGFCPFCADTIDSATFPFPDEIIPGGRISKGACRVVPNILAYSTYSAVGIYDPGRHFLSLGDFTFEVLSNALSAMAEHGRLVRSYDSRLSYSSINANYLPSSGSSLIHPHLQSSHDFVPFGSQRRMKEVFGQYFEDNQAGYLDDLVRQERNGPRWVGSVGGVDFLVPFAPSGFHEVWGVVSGVSDIVELTEGQIEGLASGIEKILGVYQDKHLSAFNYSLQGLPQGEGGEGSKVLYRITTRSSVEAYYRSDITYFERLCAEPMIDYSPEAWASELLAVF
jgi:galactose-1-phosphate uridylyltransferase